MKLTIQEIAKVCHETNRAYCLAQGDKSQAPWEQAEQWQRDSMVAGVEYHIANPHSTPADSHQAWLDHKTKEGWKFGLVKDAARKEHPSFLPFDKLPTSERAKDHIVTAIIKTLQEI